MIVNGPAMAHGQLVLRHAEKESSIDLGRLKLMNPTVETLAIQTTTQRNRSATMSHVQLQVIF